MSNLPKKHLVISDYWIGDTLKTQTVCEILKEQDPSCTVDFITKWPQLYLLLSNNPYIDNVILVENTFHIPLSEDQLKTYDTIRRNSGEGWTPIRTPGELYQLHCGIKHPKKYFKVYTDPTCDKEIKHQISKIRSQNKNKLVIAVDVSWRGRKQSTSQIEPIDIMKILTPLYNEYVFIPIGIPPNPNSPIPVQTISARGDINVSCAQFTSVASTIKYSDALLASESGILNTGIGIGTTPIIYAKDFLYALAGPHGSFGKSSTPEKFMGPEAYEGVTYVDTLAPDLTDETYLPAIKSALISLQSYYNLKTR